MKILNPTDHPVGTRFIFDDNPRGVMESLHEATVIEWSKRGSALLEYKESKNRRWVVKDMPFVVEVL